MAFLGQREVKLDVAEDDPVPILEAGADDAVAVDDCTIGGMEIAQFEIAPVDGKHGMMLGHTGMIETDRVVSGTTDRDVIR